MLAEAALQDDKVAPLLTSDKKQIRLRALQHMIVCNLRRDLAGEVKDIYETKSAPPDQMERVRKLMKHYGLHATLFFFFSFSPQRCKYYIFISITQRY